MNIDKQTITILLVVIFTACVVVSMSSYASYVNSNKPTASLESNDGSVAGIKYQHTSTGDTYASWEFLINISDDCTYFYVSQSDIIKVCSKIPKMILCGKTLCTNGILVEQINENLIKIQMADFIKNGSIIIVNDESLQIKMDVIRED